MPQYLANIELSALDGSNGFKIAGGSDHDKAGHSVSYAGDINGDGFADVIVGAPSIASTGFYGASYVVFGHAGTFSPEIDMSTLDGSDGFRISALGGFDSTGNSVGFAGDVNGDGIDDLIIGAPKASPHGNGSGAAYVVFGHAGGFAAISRSAISTAATASSSVASTTPISPAGRSARLAI